MSAVLHHLAVLPSRVLAAGAGAALIVTVVPAVAIHNHRTRKAHR